MHRKAVSLTYILTGYLLIPIQEVFAQGYQPLTPNASQLGITGGQVPNIAILVDRFFKIGLSILGLLAVIMVTIGGIKYMGSNSVFGKDAGKKQIQAAIGGLILGLGAWLLLRTINPQLIQGDTPNVRFNPQQDTLQLDIGTTPQTQNLNGTPGVPNGTPNNGGVPNEFFDNSSNPNPPGDSNNPNNDLTLPEGEGGIDLDENGNPPLLPPLDGPDDSLFPSDDGDFPILP